MQLPNLAALEELDLGLDTGARRGRRPRRRHWLTFAVELLVVRLLPIRRRSLDRPETRGRGS